MIKKYPGLVQIVRRDWLIKRVESIMDVNANSRDLKECLKDISKVLMVQEKHRMLHLQNNLYEKVQYYIKSPNSSSSPSINIEWNYEEKPFAKLFEKKWIRTFVDEMKNTTETNK